MTSTLRISLAVVTKYFKLKETIKRLRKHAFSTSQVWPLVVPKSKSLFNFQDLLVALFN